VSIQFAPCSLHDEKGTGRSRFRVVSSLSVHHSSRERQGKVKCRVVFERLPQQREGRRMQGQRHKERSSPPQSAHRAHADRSVRANWRCGAGDGGGLDFPSGGGGRWPPPADAGIRYHHAIVCVFGRMEQERRGSGGGALLVSDIAREQALVLEQLLTRRARLGAERAVRCKSTCNCLHLCHRGVHHDLHSSSSSSPLS
jgi:hypothetical protein